MNRSVYIPFLHVYSAENISPQNVKDVHLLWMIAVVQIFIQWMQLCLATHVYVLVLQCKKFQMSHYLCSLSGTASIDVELWSDFRTVLSRKKCIEKTREFVVNTKAKISLRHWNHVFNSLLISWDPAVFTNFTACLEIRTVTSLQLYSFIEAVIFTTLW